MMTNTKKMAVLAMLCAVAFVITVFGIPVMPSAPFLSLDFKDAIIVISGFMFGPLASLGMTLVVATIELFTISEAGVIGMMMNMLSSGAFACTAASIYRKYRNMTGAVVGLITGVSIMTVMMILWNYTMTPIYMGIDRAIVVDMLVPVFLPFNLLKGTLNAAIALFLYKPLTSALRKAKLMPPAKSKGKLSVWFGTALISAVVIVTCVLIILVINQNI